MISSSVDFEKDKVVDNSNINHVEEHYYVTLGDVPSPIIGWVQLIPFI